MNNSATMSVYETDDRVTINIKEQVEVLTVGKLIEYLALIVNTLGTTKEKKEKLEACVIQAYDSKLGWYAVKGVGVDPERFLRFCESEERASSWMD